MMKSSAGQRPKGRNSVVPYLLLAPGMLATALFVVVPLLLVFALAFFNLNLVTGTSDFVGLQNFAVEFVHPEFARSVSNTLLYALYTIIPSMAGGLVVALLIHGLSKGQGFWRSVYFLPVATTLVAMSAVWRWMFRADTGVVDTILGPIFGIRDWLNDPQLALHAIAVVGNWHQIGLVTVLYLAALGSLPRDPLESAQIDGAGPWAKFWHVTWPALGPTTVFAFITTASSALQAYDTIAAMTQGGPLGSTETLTYMIWVRGIHYFDIGRAAVLSIALLLLSVLATLAQRTGYGRKLEQGGAR
ncbi:sugar ABC transporter permease [Leucobacter sp. UT-8R-CII-1-4]|uniref:carbohydrate ABC transporter permease n=1 Tax=Leucobacter sp. UT-8R-CII-1-4 TaxID=3040075 RepID=UPI0024A8DBB3|nr:sugar ABC transporter permease [Leucobacter sp. UT-8R-CII-1-4]MDI6022858.1 sugar ABC transporter permease [Leucobacter sp. UT-8R-CII-1-4]